LAVLILANISFAGTYGGGSGTELLPYQIGSIGNWQELKTTSADWGEHFILTADLDFDGLSLTPVGISGSFTGVFDGQGHVIRNAVISGSGLFSHVSIGGQIHNLGVEDINVTGGSSAGGLVGVNDNGVISSCYATGVVSGDHDVGGLVGWNAGVISSCYSTCAVSGDSCVGGLVGMTGNGGIGGCEISTCYAVGVVSGSGCYVGGLVGTNYAGSITACFYEMQTSGQASIGGGIGLSTAAMQDSESYLRLFWDFKGEIKNGINGTWAMPQGGGYPVLAWQLDDSPVSNDEMSNAIAVTAGSAVSGTSIRATGLDLTRNGYNDWADVWYYFDCSETGKYTVTVEPEDFNSTVAVFDGKQTEIVFNDDFFGGKSVVILRAATGRRYYIRVSGCDGQTGNFTLAVEQGAIQVIQGDLNYDGMVDLVDFAVFAGQWLEGM